MYLTNWQNKHPFRDILKGLRHSMDNPVLLTIITIVIWSFGQYIGRLISLGSPYLMLALSSLATCAFFLVYFFVIQRQSFAKFLANVKPEYFFFGLFGYAIYQYASNQCFLAFNNGSEPTILNYTWPLFTILFAYIFFPINRKHTASVHLVELGGIFIGFFSIILLATQGHIQSTSFASIQGLAWGLFAGASYGLFSAYSGSVTKERQGAFLLASIVASMLVLFVRAAPDMKYIASLTWTDIGIILISGIVISGVADLAWTSANRIAHERHISITKIASLIFLLPLLSITVIAIFLHEWNILAHWYVAISLLAIALSSYLCQRSEIVAHYISVVYKRRNL